MIQKLLLLGLFVARMSYAGEIPIPMSSVIIGYGDDEPSRIDCPVRHVGSVCPVSNGGTNVPITIVAYPPAANTIAYFPIVFPQDAPYSYGCQSNGVPWSCCTAIHTGCNTPFNLTHVKSFSQSFGGGQTVCRRFNMAIQPSNLNNIRNYEFGPWLLFSDSSGLSPGFPKTDVFGAVLGPGLDTGTIPIGYRGRPMVLTAERRIDQDPLICPDNYPGVAYDVWLDSIYGF